MKIYATNLLFFFFLFTFSTLQAQDKPSISIVSGSTTSIQDLVRANAFIAAYRNDTARIIVKRLMDEVTKQNQLDSPFGLKVQLAQGTALEHEDKDSIAMQILLHVKEQSSEKKLWDIFTQSCIALALLHENMDDHNALARREQ